MLKIKDNVDLKTLEMYDFYYDYVYGAYTKIKDLKLYKVIIRVFLHNPNYSKNEITFQSTIWYDTLFDDNRGAFLVSELIADDLVEKVVEQE